MLPLASTNPAVPVGAEVVDEVLHPGEVGVALGRRAVLPAHVLVVAVPVRIVERRIGEHVVGLEVFVQVAAERVGVFLCQGRRRCRESPGSSSPAGESSGWIPGRRWRCRRSDRRGFRRTFRFARTSRQSRSTGHRRGPCTGRAFRPASARRSWACRTGRPSCLRRWRTEKGSTRRRGPGCLCCGGPLAAEPPSVQGPIRRSTRSCRSGRSVRPVGACRDAGRA